jgi:multidrug resistance efflux pump
MPNMQSFKRQSTRLGAVCAVALLSIACGEVAPMAAPALRLAARDDTVSVPQRSVATTAAASPTPAAEETVRDQPAETDAAPIPAGPPATATRGTVVVRRGSIAELFQVNGRVVGLDEVELSFPMDGALKSVAVEAGQPVAPGQVLAELDARPLAREVDAARDRVETARIRLDQARARVAAQQWDAQQRAAEERERAAQQAAGEVRSAELAVATARANFDRAQADLARLTAPPSAADQQAAEQQIAAAQVALQRAEVDQERLRRGPDPAVIRTAERELAAAQAAFNAAQAELNRVTQGPDPYELRAAERQLEQALANAIAVETVDPARSTAGARAGSPTDIPNSTLSSGAARQAAITNARVAVDAAQDRLTKLREPPSAEVVNAARSKLADARRALSAAQEGLDAVRRGPDQLALATADAEVAKARTTLDRAEEQLRKLTAGPSEPEVRQATSAVESARLVLTNAQAQADATRTRSAGPTAASRESAGDFDLVLLERELANAQTTLQSAEAQLAAGTLKAPFAGVVASVPAQAGSRVEVQKPVVVLAGSGDAVLVATILPTDAARVRPGQEATIQVDGGDGTSLNGSVLSVGRSPSGAGSVVRLRVGWGSTRPAFGGTARANITLQTKDDTLLLPRRAVRTAGGHQYVEYLDGSDRQVAEVTVGITTTNEVEVLSGVDEGQLVLVDR